MVGTLEVKLGQWSRARGVKPGKKLGSTGYFNQWSRTQAKRLEQHLLGHEKGIQDSSLDKEYYLWQNKGIQQKYDFPDISHIFSNTTIVQPAQDHDLNHIFSSTVVVQLVKSTQSDFPFQKCSFRNMNVGESENGNVKSIFKGKAIVQPTKPFFLKPCFHDHRLDAKFQARGNKHCLASKTWKEVSTFEKGESSQIHILHHSQVQNNFGQENVVKNKFVWEILSSHKLACDSFELVDRGFLSKTNNKTRAQKKSIHKPIQKQLIFYICEGAPPVSPTQLQDTLLTNESKVVNGRPSKVVKGGPNDLPNILA